MNKWRYLVGTLLAALLLIACQTKSKGEEQSEHSPIEAAIATEEATAQEPYTLSSEDIELREELLFEEYYLAPTYDYKDTVRSIKLDQFRAKLAYVENLAEEIGQWAVIENYRNGHGEAPTVQNYRRNEYRRVADTLGVERYQSAPLYLPNDTTQPIIYGRDGWLTHLIDSIGSYYQITPIKGSMGSYWIPKRYLRYNLSTLSLWIEATKTLRRWSVKSEASG